MAEPNGGQDLVWFDQSLKIGDLAIVSKSPLCLLITFDPGWIWCDALYKSCSSCCVLGWHAKVWICLV